MWNVPNIHSFYSFVRRMHIDIIYSYEIYSYLNEISEVLVRVLVQRTFGLRFGMSSIISSPCGRCMRYLHQH
jgi:hypothetical protein